MRIGRFEAVLLAVFASGCSTSDSLLGARAESAKDYVAARAAYRRDLVSALQENPDRGLVTRSRVLLSTYNLGRMTGYTCDYVEAERLLREALRLGELMPDQFSFLTAILSDLARLTFDAGKFQDSVHFYERAIARLDKFQYVEREPIAFASYLDDYATALERGGNGDKAIDMRTRAASIRSSNPGKNTKFAPVYYRDVCGRKDS